MKRPKVTVILSAVLALILTACSAGSAGGEAGSSAKILLSGAWVDSDLIGSVSADQEIRLQDDFAAAANKEWKLEVGDKYVDTFQNISDAVIEKMRNAATDESIEGEEAEVLRKYYALSSDWDLRNSQGVEPLRPYIEDIESISSVDDLYAFFMDLERNPLALSPVALDVITGYHTEKFPDINLTMLETPHLSLVDDQGKEYYSQLDAPLGLELYEQVENRTVYMLGRMGYSEAEAKKMLKKCLIWEKKVAGSIEQFSRENLEEYVCDREKVASYAGSFPLNDLLNAWGFEDTQYLVISPRYAKKLASLCSEGNLESVKDFLIINYCLGSAMCLDRDSLDTYLKFGESKLQAPQDYGKTKEQFEDTLQFNTYIGGTSMLGALNKVYVENYFDDSVVSDLTGITEEILDGLEVIFKEEPWLTDEGKALCVEKLKNVKIHIAYQNFEVLDYSLAPFLSKEEGGNFLDAYYATERYGMQHKVFLSKQKFDRDYWDPVSANTSTTMTNAFYMPSTNGIYICAGICEPYAYSPDFSYEEKLAGLGCVVGHELTHGFDKNGALYDKDGRRNTWLPYKDQTAFNDRNDIVSAYYTTLQPYPGSGLYQGSNLSGEATADMGGLKVTLYLASKVPDFDYDLYFRSYARLWRANVPLEVEKTRFNGDSHPLAFYRVNVGLQQFDEFYETYGIKEGDGMYLDPDKRIKVW